ncbi:MAG TPA: flavoprotein, partial [Bradyrhizobium sp.]|nr:flavoprotein [Bradyrhizobium sp.]
MANLTIRKLDDAIRDELRLRAARNGRSVEDEVRVILREASQQSSSFSRPAPQAASQSRPTEPRADHDGGAGLPHVTLIIGGGIAAYKALDLIRRLKDRHIHVRCVLTRAAQQFVT